MDNLALFDEVDLIEESIEVIDSSEFCTNCLGTRYSLITISEEENDYPCVEIRDEGTKVLSKCSCNIEYVY